MSNTDSLAQAESDWTLHFFESFLHFLSYPTSRGFLVALCSGAGLGYFCVKASDFLSCMRNIIRHTYRHFPFLQFCTRTHTSA